MKKIFCFLCISLLFLYSCEDSGDQLGLDVMPDRDRISTNIDTFHLASNTFIPEAVYNNNSTYLIGQYTDSNFGAVRSDLLAQVMCPSFNISFPEDVQVQSFSLEVYYKSHTGNEPITFDVYRLTQDLLFRTKYYSNISISEYTNNFEYLLGTKTLTELDFEEADTLMSKDTIPSFKIDLPISLANEFLNATVYANENSFLSFFKGICITSKNGDKTMLSVSSVSLNLTYTYLGNGTQQSKTIKFPSNNEVKQVNAFSHPQLTTLLQQKPINYNYIYSPAAFFTKVEIPVSDIKEKIIEEDKISTLNSVKFTVLGEKSDEDVLPMPSYLLLIHQDSVQSFFEKNKIPNSSTSFYAKLDTSKLQYSFDLTYYMQKKVKETSSNEIENMVLIPVDVSFYNSSLSEVKNSVTLSALRFKTKNDISTPFKLNVIYNKYYKHEEE